jgi:hypothetical protein
LLAAGGLLFCKAVAILPANGDPGGPPAVALAELLDDLVLVVDPDLHHALAVVDGQNSKRRPPLNDSKV